MDFGELRLEVVSGFFNPGHRNGSWARCETKVNVLCRKRLEIMVNRQLLLNQLIFHAFNDRF